MRNRFSQWYDGQAAQRGCLSAPITHSIWRIANHPCCCQLGNLLLHSRARVKCEHTALLTGLGTSWGCTGGFGHQELFPLDFLALDFQPGRCEMRLSSTGADSAGGARPPGRAGVCLLFWVRCVLPCACSSPGFWVEAPGAYSRDQSEKKVWRYPELHALLEAFSVALSLADRNILRNTSCIFGVLRASLWWLQSCPEHWGWTGIKAKSPVYSDAN